MEESSDLCRSFTGSDQTSNGGVAFPEMKLPGTFRNGSVEDQNSTEGDEEEINDDEEGALECLEREKEEVNGLYHSLANIYEPVTV